MAQEVVIVGADGQEHVFPAGFDPKRAAGIVRKGAAPKSPQEQAIADIDQREAERTGAGMDLMGGPAGAALLVGSLAPFTPAVLGAAGKYIKAGAAGVKAGVPKLPIINRFGASARAASKAAEASLKASAKPLPVTPTGTGTAFTSGPPVQGGWSLPASATKTPGLRTGPKPKLSAPEAVAMLRKEYGSAKAGRMLFGKAQPELSASTRQAAIKRMTPDIASKLPEAAKRSIAKELGASTPEEAFTYASKAPNARAQEHFGDLLRKSLLERMKAK